MLIAHYFILTVYVLLVSYGAISDARSLRIPNWISTALLVSFLAAASISALPFEAIAWHIAAGVLMLAVGFALFAFNLFGGGDAKLFAVCAVWVGWDLLLPFTFSVVLIGGVLSVFVIVLRKGLGLWPQWLVRNAEGLFSPDKAIPYGIAIAAGAIFMLPFMDTAPAFFR